jgi:hypothetical protein
MPESRTKAFRIGVYLPLVDNAFLMTVKIFNGVFNGHNMITLFIIDFVNHGS